MVHWENFLGIYLRFLTLPANLGLFCTYSVLQILDKGNIFILYFSSKLIFGLVILMRGVKEINTLLDQIKMVFSLCKMSFKQNDSISPAAAGKQSSKIIKTSWWCKKVLAGYYLPELLQSWPVFRIRIGSGLNLSVNLDLGRPIWYRYLKKEERRNFMFWRALWRVGSFLEFRRHF